MTRVVTFYIPFECQRSLLVFLTLGSEKHYASAIWKAVVSYGNRGGISSAHKAAF